MLKVFLSIVALVLLFGYLRGLYEALYIQSIIYNKESRYVKFVDNVLIPFGIIIRSIKKLIRK